MPGDTPKLHKDSEQITLKFDALIKRAEEACREHDTNEGRLRGDTYYRLRVGALNLLSRLTSAQGFYVQELLKMTPNAPGIKGLLEAAREDYLEGFMADHRLLASGEVFDDLLVQAEVLLENDYKDAAAVMIRAVLENALRRICEANGIIPERRSTIQQLNEQLHKKAVPGYSQLHVKEVIAKSEVGNNAAHGRFDAYKKQDVEAFLEYARRFVATFLVP